MAADKLVIDTSIIIEYLRAKDKPKTKLFSIPDEVTIFISAVTLYELYMGATTDEKKKDIQLVTEDLLILPFNDNVAIEASVIYHDLRKTNQIIEFRDIFIAATCIVYDLPINTTNKSHFKRVKGLKFS